MELNRLDFSNLATAYNRQTLQTDQASAINSVHQMFLTIQYMQQTESQLPFKL